MTMLNARWLALSLLLATELLVGINIFTVPDLSGQTGLVAMVIASAAQSFKVAVAFMATCLLVISRHLDAITRTLGNQAGYRWWPWLAAHGLACGAFLFSSWPVLGPSAGRQPGHCTVVADDSRAWCPDADISAADSRAGRAMDAGCLQRKAWSCHRRGSRASLPGWGGFLAQEIWLPLAKMTLWCTRRLLGLIYTDVYIDNERAILGGR
jgi:hypothetical protein